MATFFYLPSTSTSTTHSVSATPVPQSCPPSTHSEDEAGEEDTLPYPTELPRSAFLAADFNAHTYLSSLRNRHQTLEDLRSDLRSRSQLLNQELMDLVNGHYEEFWGLGQDLEGGEERVEGVKVGVMGFGREVETVRGIVGERMEDVGRLVQERKRVRGAAVVGRGLMETEERISALEERLGVKDTEDEDLQALEDEDEEYEGLTGTEGQVKRLEGFAEEYGLIRRLVERLGPSHPFLMAQRGRLEELRKTLLLDLAAALRQAKKEGEGGKGAVLGVLGVYGMLGAEGEGVGVVKRS
jgi:conserved oligomeric Golgi complex subunit 2